MESFINKEIENPDERLVALVCANMLKETSYYQTDVDKTKHLIQTLDAVYEADPEFILQLAYYGRNHMNLRSTSNFLLAYASIRRKTREILKSYFRKSIRLPTDILEVVDLAQVLSKVNFKTGEREPEADSKPEWKLKLSRNLTDCIKFKFGDFNEYQLGKYCSEGRRKRKLLRRKRLREKERELLEEEANSDKTHVPTKWKIEGKVLVFYPKEGEEDSSSERGRGRGRARLVMRGGRGGRGMPRGRGRGMPRGRGRGAVRGMSIPSRGAPITGRGGKKIKPGKEKYIIKHKKVTLTDIETQMAKNTPVNMKKLIKFCKISRPQILVKKILGVKYPTSEEEYNKLLEDDNQKNLIKKLGDGSKKFDSTKVGKRMKLEIPKTWEVEVTKKGNKKEVWEELVENKNLPILATIRNLRNVITSDTKEETHEEIMKNMNDFDTITKSRIMPFQFYNSYKNIKTHRFDPKLNPLVNKYLDALEGSLRISTLNNITKLQGNILIFVDVSGSMEAKLSGHSDMSMKEAAVLLGLMVNFSCDKSEFRVFSSPSSKHTQCHLLVNLDTNYILKNFDEVNSLAGQLGGGTDLPIDRLEDALKNNEKFDYIFIISDMMINPGESFMSGISHKKQLCNFLSDYREKVNPYMKYVAINLNSYGAKLDDDSNLLNIFITGFSDKILSIVADSDPKSQVKKIKEICEEELKKPKKEKDEEMTDI